MHKKLITPDDWKKPKEMIIMSPTDALQLLREVAPHVAGKPEDEHKKLKRLADLMGIDMKMME